MFKFQVIRTKYWRAINRWTRGPIGSEVDRGGRMAGCFLATGKPTALSKSNNSSRKRMHNPGNFSGFGPDPHFPTPLFNSGKITKTFA
ncbi:hypothetical protein CRP01_38215 [Flavilitoribacter nigricans DSM 23189 = NBRC 102662]|uniref:Uncharacterized protein n=1 Tax=Flavilitoribacter nigricans (strain ATCC 23147 / DSM 23189 / NBRC 102662 / NCIMB 1420 / SS-2) TaxID=1122177 RepID=A0A2D0MYP9_FLAN2|nr:hypothetical protein CRP01_38215 [Flavilitoribacter nigricans DSM 23189 = NBRC 102662]